MKNYNSKKLALNLVNSIHGSGIDADYTVTETQKYIRLNNSYHCMDEYGYYEGWFDFSVLIDKKTAKVYKIKCSGSSFYWHKHIPMIREYLEHLYFDPMFYEYKKRPYHLKSFLN